MRISAALSALVMMTVSSGGLPAQKLTPEELAGRLSGMWVLNRELSSGFRAPGRRGGLSTALALRFVSSADSAPQRGRGGSGGGRDNTPTDPSDHTPEQREQQAAMRQLQQIADRVTIAASVGSVTWGLDEAGRLVLTAKLESMTLMTPDEKAVFDRQ